MNIKKWVFFSKDEGKKNHEFSQNFFLLPKKTVKTQRGILKFLESILGLLQMFAEKIFFIDGLEILIVLFLLNY